MMPLAARVLVLLLLAGFLAPDGSAASDRPPHEQGIAPLLGVRVEQGRLFVDVRDAPLADVLRAIGEQTAIVVTIRGGGLDPVTESFADAALDEGIRRLAQGHDVVLVYTTSPGRAGRRRLAEVRIYADSNRGATVEASTPAGRASTAVARAGAPAGIDEQERAARLQAVRALTEEAREQKPEALAALTDLLTSDVDPVVRQNAAYSIGKLQAADAMAALTSALADPEPSVRAGVVSSLGRIQESGVAEIVAGVLKRDSDPRVRHAAVWALSAYPSDDARREVEVAASDPDPGVRAAAAQLISRWERQTN
jgi:hypothetical protein